MRFLALSAAVLMMFVAVGSNPAASPDNGPLPETEQRAVVKVVKNQLAAFQMDDAEAAFSFAAPGIQALFGSPERFMRMVRNTYQPVYRPHTFAFGPAASIDGDVIVPLLITVEGGEDYRAFYSMERVDSTWRISGVRLVSIPGQDA